MNRHRRTNALIEALADGVSAYLTLQARCGLWPAYSEYLLYDPIVRIGAHLRWEVNCEYRLPKKKIGRGDNPRLDFMFISKPEKLAVAMEVKWARDPKKEVALENDLLKLRGVQPPDGMQIDARLMLVAGPHQIKVGESPLLRSSLKGIKSKPVSVRALGVGKRAWGASVFEVSTQTRLIRSHIKRAD